MSFRRSRLLVVCLLGFSAGRAVASGGPSPTPESAAGRVAAVVAAPGALLRDPAQPGDFALVEAGRAADILIAPGDFKVVAIAVRDFAADVERVTGVRPVVRTRPADTPAPLIMAGTLGHSEFIDRLVSEGKLDVGAVRGQWETFLIATVSDPRPGVKQGLVAVGSDRRGTAFALYELSQAIGVSPWCWWADVTPAKHAALHIAAGTRKFGPPSVRYRGIFLNDEDWGLRPWASKTFAPDDGNIGPKTYAKIFELLLRLKANTLWPAMHPGTRPFNDFAADAPLADDYAIVMGSSHAEPMLRDNVGEWKAPKADYNYVTNRAGVRRYWEERLAANGHYENIYTLGMRGIHDSGMVGPKTDAERIRLLGEIFADQRALIAKHVRPVVERVPQMFCVYKEVLDLYRQGLAVPDDVTIVWPDDNFGYIRNFASAEEQKRGGGFGVYYHISYLGRPLSYLWLCTTPPALIWEEMSKAFAHGARRMWILNVGDIKPAGIDIEFFMQMAWDIDRWRRDNLAGFLPAWAAREFGPAHAGEIAAIMKGYYRLNFFRKPEHLQWWLPGQPPRPSPLDGNEVRARLDAWAELARRADRVALMLPPEKHDAFYELVRYPVRGAMLANRRYFLGELAALRDDATLANRARDADAQLKEETRFFNEDLAGGKWRGILALEPADGTWKSMRIASWMLPHFGAGAARTAAGGPAISIPAGDFSAKTDRKHAAWQIVPGLGRTGKAVAVFPTTAPDVPVAQAAAAAPRLDYRVTLPAAGEFNLAVHLLPTHPISGDQLRLAVAWDDAPPQRVALDPQDGSPAWAQGVLDGERVVTVRLSVKAAGAHTLRVYGIAAGVVIDRLTIASAAGETGKEPRR
jgi:hypothetical protein